YNFKYVSRFDRCTTCHLGIDRPTYTRDALVGLIALSPEEQAAVDEAAYLLNDMRLQKDAGLRQRGRAPRTVFGPGAGPIEAAEEGFKDLAKRLEAKRQQILKKIPANDLANRLERQLELENARKLLARRLETLEDLPEAKKVPDPERLKLTSLSPD